jgi:hypothetical protein
LAVAYAFPGERRTIGLAVPEDVYGLEQVCLSLAVAADKETEAVAESNGFFLKVAKLFELKTGKAHA